MNDKKDRVFGRRSFNKGDLVLREGDIPNGAYLVQEGKIEVFTLRDQHKCHIAYVGKEEVIGEMGLIDDAPRSASAIAVEPTVCIFVDRPTFEAKMRAADPIVRALIRILSSRLRRIINAMGNG